MGAFCVAGVRYRRRERPVQEEAVGEVVRRVADLVRGRRDLQAFLVANALWELALAALKTFVVLYVTKTLGLSLAGSSLAIGVAASVVLVGAVVSGKIGDNLGRVRVMRVALVVYGLGLLIPFASTVPWVVASRRRWSPSAVG
jgi:MFS-type transporter involved in bile tolerance (Atg22 family)